MMTKGLIHLEDQEEDLAILNVYLPKSRASKYVMVEPKGRPRPVHTWLETFVPHFNNW